MATSTSKKNADGSVTSTSTISNQLASGGTVTHTNADGTKSNYFTGTPSSGSGGGGYSSGGGSPSIKSSYDPTAYLKQMQDGINSLYDNQAQTKLAQLRSSQQKAIGQVNQQKAEVAPQYQNMRNQSDVVSNQNVQKLRELMASNGLNASGENVTASVGLQNARQGALNNLNTQEQQTMNDFNRQIANINDQSQEQALISDLETQRAQALLNAGIRADDRSYQVGRDGVADNQWQSQFDFSKNVDSRNFNYQQSQDAIQKAMNEAGLTGKYNGQNTMAMQQYLTGKAMQEAGLTGQYNGKNTMDYTSMLAQLTGKINGKDTYQATQDKLTNALNAANVTGKYNGKDTLAAQQLAEQKSQFKTTQEWQKYVYNHLSETDKVQLEWAKQQFGEQQAYDLFALKSQQETALAKGQYEADAYSGALNLIP